MRHAFKVAVAGTHSTGKTTFLRTLQHHLEQAGYSVETVSDLGEEAAIRGFPILYRHTPQSTLWIMTRGVSLELEADLRADVVLVDRPVPDALGYYRAALAYRDDACPEQLGDYLLLMAWHAARVYDLIFKTVLDASIPLGDNKPRDRDARFRLLADRAITDVLADLEVSYQPLTSHNTDHAIGLTVARVRDCLGLPGRQRSWIGDTTPELATLDIHDQRTSAR